MDWCGPFAGFLAMGEAFKKSGTGVPDYDEPGTENALTADWGISFIWQNTLELESDPC